MLHGFTDSSYSFQSLMDRLDPTIQAIAIDQRGHGESSKPGCCYAPQDFAADVVAFMDARQIKAATIVGHSMGGVVAQLVAIRSPERVSGLVIVGSSPSFANPAVEGLLSAVKELSDPIDRKFAAEFQASTISQADWRRRARTLRRREHEGAGARVERRPDAAPDRRSAP